jgi:hypothetical protein
LTKLDKATRALEEALEIIKDQRRYDLPVTMAPGDVEKALGISYPEVLDLFHSTDFPSFKIGRLHKISRDNFLRWLNSRSKHDLKEVG